MSNVSEIVKGVKEAKKALGDLVVTVPFISTTSTYNRSTGKVTESVTTPTIELVITSFEFTEIDGVNVKSEDLKGVVFDTDKDIDTNDRITYDGVNYKILAVKKIMAGTTLVALELHLRK